MLNKLIVLMILTTAFNLAAKAQIAPTERRVRQTILNQSFESSYLGVQTEDISKENFSKYGLSTVRGVGVDKVLENSPAAKSGLQKGDVILQFEGEEIASVRKLTRLVTETAPDHTAKLLILRDGGEREISVTLGKRDLPQMAAGNFSLGNMPDLIPFPRSMQTVVPFPPMADGGGDSNVFIFRGGANRQIGIGVTPLTKQLGDYFGAAEGKGLLINDVRENSPAAKAGLKAGDVIVQIEGKEIKAMPDLIRAIGEKKEGGVSITFLRDKNRQTVSVTPETVKSEDVEKPFGDAPNPVPNN